MTADSPTAFDRSTSAPAELSSAISSLVSAADWIRRIAWVALRLGTILATLWMIRAGIRFRDQLWISGDAIHFRNDIQNTLHQGEAVIAEGRSLAQISDGRPLSWSQFFVGYLHRYDTVYAQARDDRFDLDYTPARLLIAAMWVRELQADHPRRSTLIDRDLQPLLNFNTGCELASAVAMFLLVRHWWVRKRPIKTQRKTRPASGPAKLGRAISMQPSVRLRSPAGPAIVEPTDAGWILGFLAALALWWNPALLLDSHEWPQWDVWLLPFFLSALWLASCQWWFVAGALIAVAAMFKGQILLVLPVVILWPVFSGHFAVTARLVVGALFATALMTSPWLVGGGGFWVAGIVLATIALAALSRRGDWIHAGVGGWLSAIAVAAFVIHPWIQAGKLPPLFIALPLMIAILGTPWLVRRLSRGGAAVWIALVATGTIVAASSAFSGTWSWLLVGFCFPTWHFPVLANGFSQNVPAILQQMYQWRLYDRVFTLDLGRPSWRWDISIKILLSSIYGLTLLLCGIAAAIHARRNDPRVLLALAAPWVLMFALCPQMHTRYLVWAAAAGSVGWAISVELALMNLVVTALSFTLMLHTLLQDHGGHGSAYPKLFDVIQATYPGLSWMVALVAAIYLYQVMAPIWVWKRSEKIAHDARCEESVVPISDGSDRALQGVEVDGLGEMGGETGLTGLA